MNETADGAGSSKAGLDGGHVPEWIILALACVAQFMVVLDSRTAYSTGC